MTKEEVLTILKSRGSQAEVITIFGVDIRDFDKEELLHLVRYMEAKIKDLEEDVARLRLNTVRIAWQKGFRSADMY